MSQRESLSTINPASILPHTSPPTPTPENPLSSPSSNNAKQLSKVILRTALQKANSAVMCDSSNDVVGAIDAYSEAISLLNRVLSTVDKGSDRRRLQEIHDSYSERIRLLSAISPKVEPDDIYETFDNEENIAEDDDDDDEYEVATEDDDSRSWLTKPARRNFSGRRTNQPTYAAMIRRMASSSSLESSMSTPEDQQRWQAKRSINTTTSTSPNTESADRPSSPISSKSTPTLSNNRKSNNSHISDEGDHHNHNRNRNRSPSASSNDSVPDPAKESYQSSMTLSPLLSTKTENTASTAPMSSTSTTPVAAVPSPPVTTTTTISTISTISTTTTTTPAPTVVPSSIRTSSLRHQPSNPALSETKSMSTVSSPTTMVVATRKSSTSGFSSVRKSNRLSRVSMDGRRTQAAPLFGLFMKDLKNDNSNHSMDYLGGATHVGVAVSADLSMDQQPLRLVLSLERSMDEGAYVTPRLYIPKNMWHQPSIRLPHTEIKIAACESLMGELAKLERWAKLDDLTGTLKILEALEDAVESLQTSLSKKLKRESMNAQSPTNVSSSASSSIHDGYSSQGSNAASVSMSSNKKSQSFMSWGTKLSKSVERMNAFSLTKAEDQYRNYVEVLQRLFIKANILVIWWDHYVAMKKDVNRASPVCDVVLQRLTRICDAVDIVVGGFVVRDVAILLGKWLKRGGSWVND